MPYCTRCGKPISEGERCSCTRQLDTSSFSSFLRSLAHRMGIGGDNGEGVDRYEHGQKIIPDNIVANEGEVPVRQYDLCILRSRLKFMHAEGRLQVTNKRVLFRARGTSLRGRTTLQHEFAIDEIAGFQINRNYRFSLLDLLLGILIGMFFIGIGSYVGAFLYAKMDTFGLLLAFCLGIASMAPALMLHELFLPKYICCSLGLPMLSLCLSTTPQEGLGKVLYYLIMLITLLAGVLTFIQLFLFSFKPNLVFNVQGKTGTAVIPVRCEKGGLFGSLVSSIKAEFTGYNEVLPWTETETAIREVGAMISDIQKLGDYAIEKWHRD